MQIWFGGHHAAEGRGRESEKVQAQRFKDKTESGTLTSAGVPLVGTSSCAKLLTQGGGDGSSRWAAVYPGTTLVDKENGEN